MFLFLLFCFIVVLFFFCGEKSFAPIFFYLVFLRGRELGAGSFAPIFPCATLVVLLSTPLSDSLTPGPSQISPHFPSSHLCSSFSSHGILLHFSHGPRHSPPPSFPAISLSSFIMTSHSHPFPRTFPLIPPSSSILLRSPTQLLYRNPFVSHEASSWSSSPPMNRPS